MKVRVRLGSRPRLEKYLGWDGSRFPDGISGLAAGKGGELYVLLADARWASHG